MSNNDSLWRQTVGASDSLLGLPPLHLIVQPDPKIVSGILESDVSWLVGPPKIGKSVVAHYAAYLATLATPSQRDGQGGAIFSFEGPAECARAVDLIIESPATEDVRAVVFENPFGVETVRANSIFIAQLDRLASARPGLTLIATSRPKNYLEFEQELAATPHYRTPYSFNEWYTRDSLQLYARIKHDQRLAEHQLDVLAAPALIDDFLTHDILPGTGNRRDSLRGRFGSGVADVTLDKLAVLVDRPELALLAMLVRLQEHAPALPSVDEISAIVRFDVLSHDHLGLVANSYYFDGVRRLRFEHATTREAADLLLELDESVGFDQVVELAQSTDHAPWLRRSLDLWVAQHAIRQGAWDLVALNDRSIQEALAADMLSLSSDPTIAVNILSGLTYDSWTAQDLAYEIAAAWPHYRGISEVREFAKSLVGSDDVDGAYGLLEALLYIRSDEVKELWSEVDSVLVRLADADDFAKRKQLVLAVDGLAWRPPPDWHDLGDWAGKYIDSLSIDKVDWGFVRFMAGYHPEGVEYLRRHASSKIRDHVAVDAGIEWSREQAAFAVWLIQWHFIHQCRARSQLAHQPWIDQAFLCQSFHEADASPNRDSSTAYLIRSIRERYTDEPGWAFFLAENLRAVAPASYGALSRLEARKAIEAASPGDTGVLAAVLTYMTDPSNGRALKKYFADEQALDGLMRVLNDDLVIEGVALTEPRFTYRRSLASVYASCGIDWTDLKTAVPSSHLLDLEGRFDVDGLIRNLELSASAPEFSADDKTRSDVAKVVARARRGDLRTLDRAARDIGKLDTVDNAAGVYGALLSSAVAATRANAS